MPFKGLQKTGRGREFILITEIAVQADVHYMHYIEICGRIYLKSTITD